MIFYKIIIYSLIINIQKKQLVEIIPDEIFYPEPVKYFPENKIYNLDKFNSDLNLQKINLEETSMKYNGKLYYKDPQNYYGPQQTYRDIPNLEPDKFYVFIQNILILNFK